MARLGSSALSDISTDDLRRLLEAVYRGTLLPPFGHRELLAAGLPALVDRVTFLLGFDVATARAVLIAVIAERTKVEQQAAKAKAKRS